MREVHSFRFEPKTDEEFAAFQIVQDLVKAGHEAYIVGGAVRDRWIDRHHEHDLNPHDVDVATSATPKQVQAVFDKTVAVGINFGVVSVMLDGIETEVATFRSEEEHSDGRHPDNVALVLDPQVDASRRDFTINALFFDPFKQEVIDFFGGIMDIDRRKLRTVGDSETRFDEDKLRMMRAARFAARLDMDLDENVFAAMRKHAEEIEMVSPERIFMELTKILVMPETERAMSILLRTGILECVLPDVTKFPLVEQGIEHHPEGHVWNHVMHMFGIANCHSEADFFAPELRWAILLHDIAKFETHEHNSETDKHKFHGHAEIGCRMASDILRGFHCPNEFIDIVCWLVRQHMNIMQVQDMKKSTLRRLIGDPRFHFLLQLHELDCLASHGDTGNVDFLLEKQKIFENEPVLPKPLVSGHEVMQRGIDKGPMVGVILRELRELQLNDEIIDLESALKWLDQRCRIALEEGES